MAMNKPTLTEVQKNDFQHRFIQIVNDSSSAIQKIWKEEGELIWSENNVHIMPRGFEKKFAPKQRDEFVNLMNKYGLLIY